MEPDGPDVTAHLALAREAALSRLLLEAARLLGETLVPERVYERFREILAGAIQHDGVVVSSYDDADGTIRCDFAWADGAVLDPASFPPLPLSAEGGMQSEVIRTGRPLLTNDVRGKVQEPGSTYYDVGASGELRRVPEEGLPDTRAAMMVPLLHEAAVVGVVQVMSDRQDYDADLEVLEGLVGQMGAAVRNARLHQERARLQASEAAASAAAAEREEAARVLAAVADAVVLVDDAGVVRYRNPAADRLRADELDWAEIGRLVHTAGRAVTLPVEAAGSERWLSFVAVRSSGGTVYAIRDMTRERELEGAKSDFIATVSHELRTPTAAVFGAAQTLLRDDVDLSDEQQRELLEMIASQARRLAHVTEDVLFASSLDRNDLRVAPTELDVDELVRETARVQLPTAELRLDGGEVVADRDRLQQILVNLLDNASKYGGHNVLVSTARGEGVVRVAVEDDGMGIPPDEQPRVFEKFFRADPQHERNPTGTGLGLYICRELVERMHGRIGVDSHPGDGATFWFELPQR